MSALGLGVTLIVYGIAHRIAQPGNGAAHG